MGQVDGQRRKTRHEDALYKFHPLTPDQREELAELRAKVRQQLAKLQAAQAASEELKRLDEQLSASSTAYGQALTALSELEKKLAEENGRLDRLPSLDFHSVGFTKGDEHIAWTELVDD